MRICSVRQTSLAIINLLALGGAIYGQQATPPKPPAPAAATQPKATAATPAKKPSAATAVTKPLKTPPLPGEKVVLKVGKEQVSQADIDFVVSGLSAEIRQAVARQGKRPIGEQYVLMLVLSGQAISHRLDSSPDLRRQIDLQRLQLLAQAEYQNLLSQTKVTPEEVSQYYAAHPEEFDQAQVRQVVIRKKPEAAKEGTPGLSAPDAKAKAEEIRKALAGGSDASQVIQQYAAPGVVQIDAQPRTIRRGQLPADLDKAAFQLKEGEVSDPFETPQALVFVQVAGRRRVELKDASSEIEGRLRDQKVQATLADLRAKTQVWMDEEYFAAPTAPPTPPPPAVSPPPQP
jgi:parvulin-like peptidyl-prolyl isomerase